MGRPKLNESTLNNRFLKHITKTDSCWLWTGATASSGYGVINDRGKVLLVHRHAYENSVGDPKNFFVCHTCDNRLCVNPNHLWLGTSEENFEDMRHKNRQAKGFCIQKKLTADDVRTIRSISAAKIASQRALGKQFGVTHKAIGNVLSGRNWGWVS